MLIIACGDTTPTPSATTVATSPTATTSIAATNSPTITNSATSPTATTSTPTTTSIATTSPATTAADATSPAQFVWKTSGDAAHPLSGPFSVATDSVGNVYVGVVNSSEVQKYDSNGHFLNSIGKAGSGDGEFKFKAPGATEVALAIDTQDNLYVSDLNYRIQKFDSSGKFLMKWGSEGKGDGQFQGSIGITTDPQGNIYVSDIFNNVIQKFDPTGKFLMKWGGPGSADGQFKKLAGIALDKSGNLYAVDNTLNIMQKFDPTGKLLAKWSSGLNNPTAVTLDSQDNVYICDLSTVQKFDPTGKLLGKWGGQGSADGKFNIPTSLALDKNGNIYVADWMNDRIQKFQLR